MTLPRFAVAQCGCMDEEYQCSRKLRFQQYYLCFIFSGARDKRHQGYNYSYHRVQNSYQLFKKNHYLTLMLYSNIFTCHPFQPSSISLLRVGNAFSISSLFDVTKLQKNVLMCHRLAAFHSQCQWTRIFISLATSMAMGTQL